MDGILSGDLPNAIAGEESSGITFTVITTSH